MQGPTIGRRLRRVRRGALLAAGLVALAARPGAGQTILSQWGIAPQYESVYEVKRKDTIWEQTLGIGRTAPTWGGLSNLASTLHILGREDKARNNFVESDNTVDMKAERAGRLGKLTLAGVSHKNWREDDYSLTVRNADNLTLSHNLPLLSGGEARPEVPQVNLTLGGGWLQEKDVRENRRGGRASDSRTWATGWESDLGLNTRYAPSPTFTMTGGANWSGAVQNSRSRIAEAERDTTLDATDYTRSIGFNSETEWTRLAYLKVNLKASYARDYAQYYQASVEAQETKLSHKRMTALTLGGDLSPALSYDALLESDLDQYDYALERSDRLASANSADLGVQYDLGLPLVRGTQVSARAGAVSRRTSRENTAAYDTRERRAETELQKTLRPGLILAGKVDTELIQDFYDDGKLDRDKLTTTSSAFVTYQPSDRLKARGGYATKQSDAINISRARSAQNQNDRDYRVTVDYQATLVRGIAIQQSFQISASYTYFKFNEDKNRLTRSNRVTTKLDIPIWPNTDLNLEHIFNSSDTGAYVFATGGERRVYKRASETLRQNLVAELSYKIAGMIVLRATPTIDINSSRDLATERVTPREKRTFTGEIALQRELSNGIQLTSSFARTSSSQEDDYWNINATIAKTFD
jgi:hypothetical protein